jgi:hypothetical protein
MEGGQNESGGTYMSEPHTAHGPRRLKPAPLLYDPVEAAGDEEHFFGLESMDDPGQLLARSTELALAFSAAADRATEYQAMAAAQLADPGRFDRMTCAAIAEHAGWTEDYAQRMVDFGRGLLRDGTSAKDH